MTITHEDGRESASFFHVNRDPSVAIPQDFPPDSFGKGWDELTNYEKAWLKYELDNLDAW